MQRIRLSIICLGVFIIGCGVAKAQSTITTQDVAWFARHRLGEKGWARVCQVLDSNHISYFTVDFAATYVSVPAEQRELTKKLLKGLIEREKLPIHLSDDGGPGAGLRF